MATISKLDFTFRIKSYGCYEVTYQSPTTRKCWTALITDMTLIDATKNEDNPLKKNLNILKKYCKNTIK